MEERSNNTGLVIVVTLLVVAVLGLIGFIVYDKVINKTNEPNLEENNNDSNNEKGNENQDNGDSNEQPSEKKELHVNSNEVQSLLHPTYNRNTIGSPRWEYKDINLDTYGRANMMRAAADYLDPTSEDLESSVAKYSATEIKNSFVRLFGPDTSYYDGKLSDDMECGVINDYSNNMYLANIGCGGDTVGYWNHKASIYKAEQEGDYIYTYFYVQHYFVYEDAYLFDREKNIDINNISGYTKKVSLETVESTIISLMNKGEVDTYKFTFKKQSDGNYYFYSGAWEN